ncbi:MAG: CARDB domain-containing protein [Pirellulaceae bacterium]
MSSRRIVFLLTCLLGLVWAATGVRAQDPVSSDRHEPAPLRKEGFIQQLRALPQASVQALQEAEERQFRLPPRTDPSRTHQVGTNPVQRAQVSMRAPDGASPTAPLHRNYNLPAQPTGRSTLQHTHESPWVERMSQRESTPVQITRSPQSMPPTYRGLQNRPATSYQLIEERSRFSGRLRDRNMAVGDWEPVEQDFSESAQRGVTVGYSEADLAKPGVARTDAERSENGRYDEQPADQQLLGIELDSRPDSRNPSLESLSSESLQRAPRVSRVPLPRPAVSVNDDVAPTSPSEEAKIADAPARIVATPTSATPQLGSSRINTATLKSTFSDIHDANGPDISMSLSLPKLPLPALADSELPVLQSTLPSPAVEADSKPADLPSTNHQSLSDRAPENSELPLPSIGPAPLEATLPAAPSVAVAGPETPNPANLAPIAPATPSHHMPRSALEGEPVNNRPESRASSDQRLKMEAPRITVVLNGPSDLPIGTPAPYEIVVRNEDSIDLQGLILRMDIPSGVKVNALKPTHGKFELETAPDGLTMVTWGFEHLTAGQTASAPMQLVAGSAQNFAVAMEWTLVPIAGTSPIDVRTPRLELALDGPAEVRFGEANTYRLHIRNPGNAPANQITVRLSAEPFGSSAAEIERIAPGEEEVIEVELTFNERGSINIVALAEEQSGLESQTAIAVIVRQAMVKAQLHATPLVYHGTPTECYVRLTNSGDADALDLRAALQLPEGAGLVSAPPGAVLSGRELTWRIDQLVAGGSEQYTVQLKLTADGANALSLQCDGPSNVSAAATTVTQVESITDLKLFVNDPIAPAPVGSEVVYELTLTNRGSKAATNVRVIAQFSDGIEPTRGEGHAARVVPGQTLFEPLPRLAAGETVNLKVFAKAAASGTHRFRVEVRADESEVRLVQEESTQYLEPVSRMAAPMATSSTLR